MKTQILEEFKIKEKDSNRKEEEDEEDIEAGKNIIERRFRLWKERIELSKKEETSKIRGNAMEKVGRIQRVSVFLRRSSRNRQGVIKFSISSGMKMP
jgi:hypothetical protein